MKSTGWFVRGARSGAAAFTMFATAVSSARGAPPEPVETAVYPVGAWFTPTDDAQRAMYLKGGFTLTPHRPGIEAWAREHGLSMIAAVRSHGLPASVAQPFENARGAKSMSVGPFTHINFNAPEVEAWWAERVPAMVRETAGAERVRYWKVHNEFGYHSADLYDYSPGSIARYRRWLAGRYGDVETLNARWRTTHAAFDVLEPPRARKAMLAEMANWLDWRRFTCWNFADYFRTSGDMIRSVVPDAAVSDNFYSTSPLNGWDIFELARQTDYVAFDIYSARRWPRLLDILDQARGPAVAWGKPFILMEYHAGPNHWIPVMTHRDIAIEAGVALARECRAIMWFRWIPGDSGREQGIHGLMDSQGRPTERYTAAAETSAFCRRLAPLLLRTRTVAPVALLTSSDDAFLAEARGESRGAFRRRWDHMAYLLSAAGVACDLIDPVVLAERPLDGYRAIIAGHVEALSDEALAGLRRFADAGGVVIQHPDTALLDAFGHPRAAARFTDDRAPDGPWMARARRGGGAAVEIEAAGRGRWVHCAWDMPAERPEGAALTGMIDAYLKLLAGQAGVSPAWRETGGAPPETLDARLLETGTGKLLVATALQDEPRSVSFTIPGFRESCAAYRMTPASASVVPLKTESAPDGLRIEPVTLDPAAFILLADRPWQPLIGLDAPKTLHPGETFTAAVTIDNLAAAPVGGSAALIPPDGWSAEALDPEAFRDLPSGERASIRYRVTVPPNAAVDRFALDAPLRAEVVFAQGRSGRLDVLHLPFILPPLDVRLAAAGGEMNPWQELAPPLMRWGWQNEIRIPPPPPAARAAPFPVAATFHSAPALAGRTVELSIEGMDGATVEPSAIVLSEEGAATNLILRLPRSGEVEFVARSGGAEFRVPLRAAVEPATVEAAARAGRPAAPSGWIPLGIAAIGARDASAAGLPVSVELPSRPAGAEFEAVFDEQGRPAAFTLDRNVLTIAADVPAEGVRVFTLAKPDAPVGGGAPPEPHRRVRFESAGGNVAVITGDRYAAEFDTRRGVLRRMDIDGRPGLVHRTGVVATADRSTVFDPGHDNAVESLAIEGSSVEAALSFIRRQGDLRLEERWRFLAARIDITVQFRNDGRAPILCDEVAFEVGIDGERFANWRRYGRDRELDAGALPTGFGPLAGVEGVEMFDSTNLGVGVVLRRCALVTQWNSGFSGIRHGLTRTAIELFRSIRLDPGDTILAEFSFVPRAPGAPGLFDVPVASGAWRPVE